MVIDYLWFFCQVLINVFAHFLIEMFCSLILRAFCILRKTTLTIIHIFSVSITLTTPLGFTPSFLLIDVGDSSSSTCQCPPEGLR